MLSFFKQEEEFHYTEQGQGPVLILLHGLFGALSNFQEQAAFFSKHFTVVNLSLPIYQLPLLQADVPHLAKHVEKFVQKKAYSKVHLLGNSLGGHVALMYAAKNTSKVASLTLTGSSGLYENAFGGSFPRREDKNFLKERIALTFYDPKWVTDALIDECHEAVNNREKVIRILSLAKSAIRSNMTEEAKQMNLPVCLIWGKNDQITPPNVAQEFHKLFPDNQLFWIDQCGHAPMMEHPQEFNQHLHTWYLQRGLI